MFSLIYIVDQEKLENELAWLKSNKVYASSRDCWRWDEETKGYQHFKQVAAIVDEPTMISIKLRQTRPLERCVPYRK